MDKTESLPKQFFTRLLLIEDEAAHAALITRALRGLVKETYTANSAKEGLEKVEQISPDILFCDLKLPDLPGTSVLKQVHQQHPNVPLVVMTSSSDLDDVVEAMNAGAWDYVVKKFSDDFPKQLSVVLQRIQRRKQEQLRELQSRAQREAFWQAVQTASDALAIVDDDGRVLFANKAMESIFADVGSGEIANLKLLVGKHNERVAHELEQRMRMNSAALWSSGFTMPVHGPQAKPSSFELTLVSSVASDTPMSALDAEFTGNSVGNIVWIRDISARKERERRQRDWISTTTHDIKGPLGAILTGAEMLTSFFELEEQAKRVALSIASCARNCVTIIDELLSANKIDDGVLVIKPRRCSAHEILEDVLINFRQVAESKKVELRLVPPDLKLVIYADRVALGRVVSNLVSNAIKFTPTGGVVTLSAEEHPHGTTLHIEDTGCGIDSEKRHILFTRYGRLDKHAEVEGTGLGLFVTKNIVEAHSGQIELSSEVGKGSKFSLSFPNEAAVNNPISAQN